MLSSINKISISNSSVSCWPVLEPSLNQLFPQPSDFSTPSNLTSDDYLKLYTVVFDHCVGSSEGKKGKTATAAAGLNISGEELYLTLIKYIETRFQQWSHHLMVSNLLVKQ